MKKYIFTILMAVAAISSVSAQQKLVLKLDDGTIQVYETWEVDSLYFTSSETVSSVAPTEAIDLGFAKWAPYNLGATKQSEAGWLVGWGDVTGTNKSTKLKYFPAQVYTNDIYETAYDIAHTMWSGEWRLPVAEEMQALRDNCDWEQTVVDEVPGYRLTSKENGNSIFLPFTGYRNGKTTANVDNQGLYWSGTIGDDTEMAKALFIGNAAMNMEERDRFLGLAIRPIYGKFVHQLALTVDAPTNVTVTSVTITADVIGDVSKVSKVGVCLGKVDETVNPNDPSATNKSESDFNQNNSHVILNINDLQGNTAYKAVLYLLLTDGTMILGEPNPVQFTTLSKFPVPTTAVDLGLSVEWAPWNVGESSEWGNTHLYGWGDADGENYSTDGNLYAVGLYTGATSICGNDKYDIAAKQWGNGWRMPTFAEIKELYTSSAITITKEIVNGDIGYRFTNNQTNASILLPACGARYGNNVMQSSDFYYWTGEGSYNSVDGWKARVARPLSNTIESQQYPKFWGMAVRPVRTKNGSGGSNPGGGSSDSQATAVAGNYVNLGLSDGTLWADRNVGASRETDYGDYFAWAETEPRTTNFDAAHYKYYNSSTNTYEKTGTDAYDINGEWLICGNENYDAAAKLWKGSWRMPTDYQITCLVNECNWEWKTNYRSSGHNGYLVTGPNGNSIFLPAAGFMSGDSFSLDGEEAYYWSGALNTQQTSFMRAFAINFSSTSHARVFTSRVGGRSIRPVITR